MEPSRNLRVLVHQDRTHGALPPAFSRPASMSKNPHWYGVRVSAHLGPELLFQSVRWPRRADRLLPAGVLGRLRAQAHGEGDRPWARGPLGHLITDQTVGSELRDAVPTASGRPLVRLAWVARDRVRLAPLHPGCPAGELSPDDRWSWQEGPLRVDLDLVGAHRGGHGRAGQTADPAFAALFMLLVVGSAQVVWVAQRILSNAQAQQAQYDHEPSPEMIARLLNRDYDGEKDGTIQEAERPEHERQSPSYYLPAGNTGPLDRMGGGAVAGDEVSRAEPEDSPDPDAAEAVADATDSLPGAPDQLELDEAPPAPPELAGAPEDEPLADDSPYVPNPVERFVGWGFKDWLDSAEAPPEEKQRWARELNIARVRLQLDPDDPYALNVVGLYAYLAENRELSRQTYERMLELYPDAPAAYNNYALTMKREGRYREEEALYRQALQIDPLDTHVLNNLAVCLAHQGRFDEALSTMDRLEALDPDDAYARLHRAKIYAAMGKRRKALRALERALKNSEDLDTMHHVEFRQDIRLDPVFDSLRDDARFARILRDAYGEEAEYLLSRGGRDGQAGGGSRG